MSDLTNAVALQARLFEFLARQDEATLQGIVSGTVRLAAIPAGEVQAPTDLDQAPPDDPGRVARDLPKLLSEHERRVYLNASGMTLNQLRSVAKLLGVTRYSGLTKPKLVDRLAGKTDTPPSPTKEKPATVPVATTTTSADVAAIAARLREIETEEEGAAYLRAEHLDREGLLGVAAELLLTRVDRLKQSELEKRVLKQAIGARRKFAGLRKW